MRTNGASFILCAAAVSALISLFSAPVPAAEKELRDATVHHVSSALLDWISYEPKTETLTARFDSGGVYEYYKVPRAVVEGLLSSDAKDDYFERVIQTAYAKKQLNI